jgi:hypothetical protein
VADKQLLVDTCGILKHNDVQQQYSRDLIANDIALISQVQQFCIKLGMIEIYHASACERLLLNMDYSPPLYCSSKKDKDKNIDNLFSKLLDLNFPAISN